MSNSTGESPPYLITEPLRSFTPIQLANGDLRMAIAVAGQKAYSIWGDEATLTEEFLSKDHRTWEGGLISTNHENTNDLLGGASLYDLEFDSEKKLVIASFANLPDKAKAFISSEFYQGLSQECIPLQFKKDSNDVIKGYGTGVTIVMWPHQPAATQKMGVGVRPALAAILASKYPQEDTMTNNTGGGTPAVSVEAFESTVSENVQLKSTLKVLETDNKRKDEELASWQRKYAELESGEDSRTKIAVEAALESYRTELRATAEREEAVKELKSIMSEKAADEYLSTKPTVDQIRSISKIMRANSAGGVGHNGGSGSSNNTGKASTMYESGKDIYKAAGLTEEDLEKYGGL